MSLKSQKSRITGCPKKNVKTGFLNFWHCQHTNFAHFSPWEWISSILAYIWRKFGVVTPYLDTWEIFETPCKSDFCVCRAKNWSKLIIFSKLVYKVSKYVRPLCFLARLKFLYFLDTLYFQINGNFFFHFYNFFFYF